LKQLVDDADISENRIEELTWELDDATRQQSPTSLSQVSGDFRSEKEPTKTPLSSDSKLDSNSCRTAEMKHKRKELLLKSKSHTFDDNHLQQHQRETKTSSSGNTKLLLASSPNDIAKLKKNNTGNKSASHSPSDVNKLSNKKLLKLTGSEDRSDVHVDNNLDSCKSEVQSNGDRDHWKEIGVVSFTDEAEINDVFPSRRQAPLSRSQQRSVYSDFESAVLDEYVDREPARNVGKFPGRRRTDHDSSDEEDVFDQIASGRIHQVIRQSQAPRSNYNRLPVTLHHQKDVSSSLDVVNHEPEVTERETVDGEVDNSYDSASSADTDVIIRSQRLMSEVTANLQNRPNPNNPLNVTGQCSNVRRRDQLLDVAENVSPSLSLSEDHGSTGRNRKRKRFSGEAGVKNHAATVNSPTVQEHSSVISNNAMPTSLTENCDSKRKRKSSKAGDLEATVNNSSVNAAVSPVKPSESDVLLDTADVDGASFKQRKTGVSVLVKFAFIIYSYLVKYLIIYVYIYFYLSYVTVMSMEFCFVTILV